jgi:hypothetical protein
VAAEPDEAAADDQNVGLDHHARPGFGPICSFLNIEISSENRLSIFRMKHLVDHDPFGKPASTFPDHALNTRATLEGRPQSCGEVAEWLNAPHSKFGRRRRFVFCPVPASTESSEKFGLSILF